MRKLRLKAVWLLVIPFLWLARPTPASLSVGLGLALVGLWIRAMAAGHIHKEKELTTSGPYARTRNPLYLGSFVLGLGVTVAGGRWIFVGLFLVFFALVYGRTIRGEAEKLEGLFGERYRRYAANVPIFLPRATRWKDGGPDASFSLGRYKRNREYEAALGAAAGFVFLLARMLWVA